MQLLQAVVRLLAQQLLKIKPSEEKEVDVVLGEVAWSEGKLKDHMLFCKVRATNQCATSPKVGEVLSLASCYNQGATSQNWIFRRKGRVKIGKSKSQLPEPSSQGPIYLYYKKEYRWCCGRQFLAIWFEAPAVAWTWALPIKANNCSAWQHTFH